jgi:hypothetical protein
LASVERLYEPEATFIVPGFYGAFDSHDVRLSSNVFSGSWSRIDEMNG